MLTSGDIAQYDLRFVEETLLSDVPLFNLLSCLDGQIWGDYGDVTGLSGEMCIAVPGMAQSFPEGGIVITGRDSAVIQAAYAAKAAAVIVCGGQLQPEDMVDAHVARIHGVALEHQDVAPLDLAHAVDPGVAGAGPPGDAGHIAAAEARLLHAPVDEAGAVEPVGPLGAPGIGAADLAFGDGDQLLRAVSAGVHGLGGGVGARLGGLVGARLGGGLGRSFGLGLGGRLGGGLGLPGGGAVQLFQGFG